MNKVILFSTGCPQCNVLKEKLKSANIDYVEVTDKDIMLAKGITKVPVLEVNGIQMQFGTANKWINDTLAEEQQ